MSPHPSNTDVPKPRLVPGETVVGYLDVQYASSHRQSETLPEKFNPARLRDLL